jgi:hypothetical protein
MQMPLSCCTNASVWDVFPFCNGRIFNHLFRSFPEPVLSYPDVYTSFSLAISEKLWISIEFVAVLLHAYGCYIQLTARLET